MRKVLIDEWFPIDEISVESVRERAAMTALPPIYYLHIWFARRPLIASRASVVTSLLTQMQRKEVLDILGIPSHKDLGAAKKSADEAKARSQKLQKNPFDWKRAFTHVPSAAELDKFHEKLTSIWGSQLPIILDPLAGGGSIPYECARLGLPVIAGDLNPVAFTILKATVEYPVKFRERLIPAIEEFCSQIQRLAQREIAKFYPKESAEGIFAYLWARTIRCQSCDLQIPLSPNWWISKEDNASDVAVKLIIPKESNGNVCSFEIIEDPKKAGFDPDEGTDIGKEASCPRCRSITNGMEVRRIAQSGAMGHQLYAVCTKTTIGRKQRWHFRTPTPLELKAVTEAQELLVKKADDFRSRGLMPDESYFKGFSDRCSNYGVRHWRELFNFRQLLAHLIYLEKYIECKKKLIESTDDKTFAEAICVYGAMVFDTCVDYDSILTRWRPTRQGIADTMAMQSFPFKSSYAEWDHPGMLWPWAQKKIVKSVAELIKLLPSLNLPPPRIYNSDSSAIQLPDRSVDLIVVDPPYGNNVMYAEISDFFYVWLKRMIGDLFPDSFKSELTNKLDEAVANPALYRDTKKSKEIADQHYYSKMLSSFREMNRVLKNDGVLTVMFTHREVEAWTGLAKALGDAGFTFKSSWPVLTEPGQKFGKVDKGVLKVTIILSCRKREFPKRGLWSEVERELKEEADSKVLEYSKLGLQGMNLLVSIYGPVLGKFTDYTIIKDAYGNVISPEQALDVVSEAVNRFNTAEIAGSDLMTLAYVNLIKNFPALTMESDLARVTTVFGGRKNIQDLDVKGGNGLVEIKSGKVTILVSKDRVSSGHIDLSKPEKLKNMIDIVHAALRLYESRGIGAVKDLLALTGRDAADSGFISVLKVIVGLGMNGGLAKRLVDESSAARLLLESLGHQPEGVMKKGERMDHYLRGQTTFTEDGKLRGDKDIRSFGE